MDKLKDDYLHLRIFELKSGKLQLTDSTNAERLCKEHGENIRYMAAWKKWIVWNGKFWKTDDSGALISEKCLATIRSLHDEQLRTGDSRERMEIEKFAKISENARRRKSCIEMATQIDKLNITSELLDTNPWLLNCQNGTLNIQTKEFRKHNQKDFITKIANVEYDANADCPLWKQFIREIMDYKTDVINFLQTACGWAITGDIREQTMFILFGSGANGKSTFLNVILSLLGDYAMTTNTETFMKKTGEQITNDIARLRGSRFVTTTEAEEGRRLSEPLIKKITGNDQMTARFLYGEYFSFTPNFKIFMATNHKPVIKGTDYGIWRRIKLIPFTTRITEEKQDKLLEEKLKKEASGILNWLLEGAIKWQNEGLHAPSIVLDATEEYKGEMDVIGNFIKNRCISKAGIKIRIWELYKAYSDWCDTNNEHAVSERFFTMRLKDMGYEQCRNSEARFWSGLGLQT